MAWSVVQPAFSIFDLSEFWACTILKVNCGERQTAFDEPEVAHSDWGPN
jgi:hypothetical protein